MVGLPGMWHFAEGTAEDSLAPARDHEAEVVIQADRMIDSVVPMMMCLQDSTSICVAEQCCSKHYPSDYVKPVSPVGKTYLVASERQDISIGIE